MSLKREVLQSFKRLHRTRLCIFRDDTLALEAGRKEINKEYRKHMHVKEKQVISELVAYAKDIEKELRTSIIQAKEVAPGKYEAKIRPETLLNNVPYNDGKVPKKSEVKEKTH